MTVDVPRQSTRTLRGVAVAALFLAAAACGAPTSVPASQATPVGAPASALPVPGGLAVAQTPIGNVVTSDGLTLYRFEKDVAKPSQSTCTGDCASKWPPVLGDGVPAVQGIRQDLVGTVGRPDGTQQLTLNGWPLYRFAKDAKPGDVNGEGVGGTWRAIGADGKPAAAASRPRPPPHRAPAAPAAPAPAPAPAAPLGREVRRRIRLLTGRRATRGATPRRPASPAGTAARPGRHPSRRQLARGGCRRSAVGSARAPGQLVRLSSKE